MPDILIPNGPLQAVESLKIKAG